MRYIRRNNSPQLIDCSSAHIKCITAGWDSFRRNFFNEDNAVEICAVKRLTFSRRSSCLFCIDLIFFLHVFFLENPGLVSSCAYTTSSCCIEMSVPLSSNWVRIHISLLRFTVRFDPLLGIFSSFSHTQRTMLIHKNLKEFDEVVVVVVAVVVVVVIVDHYHHTPYHRSPYRRHHRRRHYYN